MEEEKTDIQCPRCLSHKTKRNGIDRDGHQNYTCKGCARQFITNPQKKTITGEDKEHIRKLPLERLSLRGTCRAMDVSLP